MTPPDIIISEFQRELSIAAESDMSGTVTDN
jgi:hypothetical protein